MYNKTKVILKIFFSLLLATIFLFTGIGSSLAQSDPNQADSKWEITVDGEPIRAAGELTSLETALFDGGVDFLGGAAELSLSLPSDGNALTLQLEARNTTGYRWELLSSDGVSFTQAGVSTFSQRSRGYGTPAVQTLVLKPNGSGNATIHLVYRRAFGAVETPRVRLGVTLPGKVNFFELLDPTPTTLTVESETGVTETYESIPDLKGLPVKFDWRSKGIVPAVRDQGGCGSCWAFGTVGVMETALAKAGKGIKNISEQFLVSCNKHGWDCGGGLTASMYHYDKLGLNQTKIGAVLEADAPYTATNGSCTVAYNHPYKLSGWKFIVGDDDWAMPTTNQIKNAIYTYGPVTAGVCVGSGWSGYSGGVYKTNDTNCGDYSNHQIVLVGWDDTLGPAGVWILRNSWGSGWGDKGYMYIPYGYGLVGQGTSWAKVAVSSVPTLKAPLGTITDTTPTYKFTPVKNATKYQFRVFKGASTTPVYTIDVETTACTSTVCSKTPTRILALASFRWQARAYVGGVWKAWSAEKAFTIQAP